jgi:phosphotriesterase-related protein
MCNCGMPVFGPEVTPAPLIRAARAPDQAGHSPRASVGTVNTVLGAVEASRLGITLVRESLLYVYPGAQYAYNIRIDRAEVYDTLARKLEAFKAAGGGTLVDATGMFEGRDLRLYEALSRATGVHIIASTGQGPEAMLGGYFLTPQTNPPTPWPAERFADLFAREVSEGMVVPRFERRAPAGVVATAVTLAGMTPTDGSLVKGAARTGAMTGVPVFIRCGSDPLAELALAVGEGLSPARVVIGDLDRRDLVASGLPVAVATAGAWIGIDHVASTDPTHLTDADRVALVRALVEAGHAGKILLSTSATGIAFGAPGHDLPYSTVLTHFVPQLRAAGVGDDVIQQILVENPANLLSVGE